MSDQPSSTDLVKVEVERLKPGQTYLVSIIGGDTIDRKDLQNIALKLNHLGVEGLILPLPRDVQVDVQQQPVDTLYVIRQLGRLALEKDERISSLARQLADLKPLDPTWHCSCGRANMPAYRQQCEGCRKPKLAEVLDAARKVVGRFYGDEEGRDGWASFQGDVERLSKALQKIGQDGGSDDGQ